jgi:hypothetical protein
MDETTAIVLGQVPTAALDLRGHLMDPRDHLIMVLLVHPTVLLVPVSMALLAALPAALTTLMDPVLSCPVMNHQRTITSLMSISSSGTEAVVSEETTASP